MAGIFPIAGVVAQQTLNAAFPVSTAEGCDALYYRANCRPMFDPVATNALISELINAINVTQPYDCSRLDNLKATLTKIQNLCTLPNATPAEIVDSAIAGCFTGRAAKISFPDLKAAIVDICDWDVADTYALSDTVAGCFGGQRKTITLQALRGVLVRLCELAVVNTAAATDTIAGCFGGQNGRISIANLSTIVGGGGFYNGGGTFGNVRNTAQGGPVSFSMAGRTQFYLAGGFWGGPGNSSIITFGMGSSISRNFPFSIVPETPFPRATPAQRAYLVIKRPGGWYFIEENGYIATYIGGSDTFTMVNDNFYLPTMVFYTATPV